MDHLVHLIKHCKMTLLSIAILITSLFSSTATVLATTPRSGVAAGEVQVTGVTVNKNDVKAGQKVNVGITFEGGQNVQPGKTITIDLPQNTTNLAGLHGVTGTINIDGTYNGQIVKNVATATISADKVTIKFNDSVTQLPNGFTGNFHFDAEAQAAQSSTDKKQPVTININGHTVVINVETGTTPVGPGVSSLKPVDVSKLYINKGGYFGKDGKINWGIDGTTPAPISSDVTITDTPSGNIKAPIDPNSWTIRVTAANGLSQFFTLQQAKDELRAKVTFDQKGGFTAVFPADVLQNTKWHIQYQAVPEKTPTNGDTFDNHAQIKYDQIVKDTDKTVQYKQNMGGEIVGFDSGNLTLQKQDGDTKVLLSGAQFTLYKDGTVVDTKTTGKDGKVVFNNLTDGNYTLKETKVPAGYQVSNKEYHFTISKGQLTNSDLPKNFILPNYKMASSSSAVKSSSKASSKKSSSAKSSSVESSSKKSSAVKSSSKASSKKSSAVKSSSKASSKKSSAVKSSSKASSKKSSSAKSSSVESSSKKSSAVKSSSKASSKKSSAVKSSSKASSKKSSSAKSSSVESSSKKSSAVKSSSKASSKKSSVVKSSSKASSKKSSAVKSSSKASSKKSSAVKSSSKASSKKSSAVKSSSKASSKKSSAVKSSSEASSKKSSVVKSSSKASSKKSSAVKSSSKASSKKSSSAKSSSVESSSSKKASSESSVSVVVSNSSSIKKGSEHHRTDHSRSMNTKSSLVSSSSKKNTEKSSSVESSSKKNTEKSSSVASTSSSKKNTEESSVMSSSTNGSAKESSTNDHKQGSSESNGKEAQSSNGHKAGVVVTNNNNGNGNNTGHGQGNGRGNGNGNGSSYGSGLPQTGETQLTISLIAGVAILAGVAGATVLNKKKK